MYVIRSYLPVDTQLNVSVIPNRREQITAIQVKSAIIKDNIQQIDLPMLTFDDDDLILSLKLVETKYNTIYSKSLNLLNININNYNYYYKNAYLIID